MLEQAGLCRTCSETTLLVFPRGGSFVHKLLFLLCLRNDNTNEVNKMANCVEKSTIFDSVRSSEQATAETVIEYNSTDKEERICGVTALPGRNIR